MVKSLPVNAGDTRDKGTLVQEDPWEEGMATNSSILACRIPWTEKLDRLWSIGLQRVGRD